MIREWRRGDIDLSGRAAGSPKARRARACLQVREAAASFPASGTTQSCKPCPAKGHKQSITLLKTSAVCTGKLTFECTYYFCGSRADLKVPG